MSSNIDFWGRSCSTTCCNGILHRSTSNVQRLSGTFRMRTPPDPKAQIPIMQGSQWKRHVLQNVAENHEIQASIGDRKPPASATTSGANKVVPQALDTLSAVPVNDSGRDTRPGLLPGLGISSTMPRSRCRFRQVRCQPRSSEAALLWSF